MAAWTKPELDWLPADEIREDDLRRIEGNADFLKRRIVLSGAVSPFAYRNTDTSIGAPGYMEGETLLAGGAIKLNDGEALYLLSYAIQKFGGAESIVLVPPVGLVDAPAGGSASASFYGAPLKITQGAQVATLAVSCGVIGPTVRTLSGACAATLELLVAPYA